MKIFLVVFSAAVISLPKFTEANDTNSSFPVCNFCPEGTIPFQPDAVVTEGRSCGEAQSAGQNGRIPPSECDLIQVTQESLIVPTCDCTEPGFVCDICPFGTDMTAPTMILPIENPITCGDAQEFGRNGAIGGQLCALIEDNQDSIIQLCGCVSTVPSVMPSEMPSIMPSMTPSREIFPVCNVCPQGTIPFKPLGILPTGETCDEIHSDGQKGEISPDDCAAIESDQASIVIPTCECTEPGYTCHICQNGTAPSKPDAFVSEGNATCEQLFTEGANGSISAQECANIVANNTEVSTLCGCEDSLETAIPSSIPSATPSMTLSMEPSVESSAEPSMKPSLQPLLGLSLEPSMDPPTSDASCTKKSTLAFASALATSGLAFSLL